MTEFITFIILIGFFAFVIVYGTFTWGWVLFKFWYWFVLPIFTNLPHITYMQAVGLSLFISLFHRATGSEKDKEKGSLIVFLIAPFLTVLIGYCFYLYIR